MIREVTPNHHTKLGHQRAEATNVQQYERSLSSRYFGGGGTLSLEQELHVPTSLHNELYERWFSKTGKKVSGIRLSNGIVRPCVETEYVFLHCDISRNESTYQWDDLK